jgi:hypothetical protein
MAWLFRPKFIAATLSSAIGGSNQDIDVLHRQFEELLIHNRYITYDALHEHLRKLWEDRPVFSKS